MPSNNYVDYERDRVKCMVLFDTYYITAINRVKYLPLPKKKKKLTMYMFIVFINCGFTAGGGK